MRRISTGNFRHVFEERFGLSVAGVDEAGDCYAGVARPITGGELIVLTQSLWWHWVNEFSSNSDNAILLRNFLTLTNARAAGPASVAH